jgi:hypothetical protein
MSGGGLWEVSVYGSFTFIAAKLLVVPSSPSWAVDTESLPLWPPCILLLDGSGVEAYCSLEVLGLVVSILLCFDLFRTTLFTFSTKPDMFTEWDDETAAAVSTRKKNKSPYLSTAEAREKEFV